MAFSYDLLKGWFAPSAAIGGLGLAGLKAEQRILLLSDGSLTTYLEALYGERVSLEVSLNKVSPLRAEASWFLEEPQGESAMEREVYLLAAGERLVFARSVIPTARMEGWLKSALNEGEEPLGRILEAHEIPVLKVALEIGVISSDDVAAGFGVPAGTPLVARRYRLVNKKSDGEWIIKAALFEVLSPALVSIGQG